MSISLIAKEVYRCQSRVHALEDKLHKAAPQQKEKLNEELRIARAELLTVRKMLNNKKRR